jgi:GNAT superfamily N-acetyltransferase
MPAWRQMSIGDVKGLLHVADTIHPDLPESEHVFAERVQLFPAGCQVLVEGDEVCGYAISHPIRHGQPPALDRLLGEIAPDADQYYIHDLAILPQFRGRGRAAECIAKLLDVAARYSTTSLVSVYGTAPFWGRYGFVAGAVDDVLSEKLRDYGEDATFLLRQNSQPTEGGENGALLHPQQNDESLA